MCGDEGMTGKHYDSTDMDYLLAYKVPLLIESIISDILSTKPKRLCNLYSTVHQTVDRLRIQMDSLSFQKFYENVSRLATDKNLSEVDLTKLNLCFAIPLPGTMFDLVPNGKNIPVTLERKEEFVELALKKRAEAEEAMKNPSPPAEGNEQSSDSSPAKIGRRVPPPLEKPAFCPAPPKKHADDSALFSPTHFSHDLFAPHATVDQVKQTKRESRRPSLPAAMSKNNLPYSPVENPALSPKTYEPLSPTSLRQGFPSMLDQISKFNQEGEEKVTESEWSTFDITWCVPYEGKTVELVPGGRSKPVSLADKDVYVTMAKEVLATGRSPGNIPPRKRMSLHVQAAHQDEEKEHALFSPTHFSKDLFAPHVTTKQLEKAEDQSPQKGFKRRASLPSRLAGGNGNAPEYTPEERQLELFPKTKDPLRYKQVLETINKINKPGGPKLTEEDWDALGMTWCVPLETGLKDLVPNGSQIKVPFEKRTEYYEKAKVELQQYESTLPAIKKQPGKRKSQLPGLVIPAKKQNEDEEHLLFSPTHFQRDLFAPHTTTDQVNAARASGRRPSLPVALTGGKDKEYEPQTTDTPPSLSKEPTVSMYIRRTEFLPMIDELEQIDMEEEEWEGMDLRWVVPVGGSMVELIPNGSKTKVKLEEKAKFCTMARSKLEEPSPKRTGPVVDIGAEMAEESGSPGLFSPTAGPSMISFDDSPRHAEEAPLSPLSPRTLQNDFLPMVDELANMGEVSDEEWNALDIVWCVPFNGKLHDIVPGGKDIKVQPHEKDRYCDMARRKLEQLSSAKSRPSPLATPAASQREQQDAALFSPTHFSKDLFAPHATTQEVTKKNSLPSLPTAIAGGQRDMAYKPKKQDESSGGEATDENADRGRMLLRMKRNDSITEEDWSRAAMTWSVPIKGNSIDLIPGGQFVAVKYKERDRFFAMAKARIDTEGTDWKKILGLKRGKPILDTMKAKPQQNEERDAALFSPTHFAHDLFAPHTTTDQVKADRISTNKKFWPIIDEIATMNTERGEQVTAEEFEDMDIYFCVPDPLDNETIHELIPNGSNVKVTLDRRDEFVSLARLYFHEQMAKKEDCVPLSPLSPRSLNAEFTPMLDEVAGINTTGEKYTAEEFAELDITWCVPTSQGIVDLIPNGRNVKVTLDQKEEYCRLAREKLSEIDAEEADTPSKPSDRKKKKMNLTPLPLDVTGGKNAEMSDSKREEREHEMFSPTHFFQDLFAPHTTMQQVQKAPDRRASLPAALSLRATESTEYIPNEAHRPQADAASGSLTPRTLVNEFFPMVEELATVNEPGGMQYTPEEWAELGITYCIPLERAHDLIPNGSTIPVKLEDRMRFVNLVREYKRQRHDSSADIRAGRTISSKIKALDPKCMQADLDTQNALFSPNHFQHDLFAPSSASLPSADSQAAVPEAMMTQAGKAAYYRPQMSQPRSSSVPVVQQMTQRENVGRVPPTWTAWSENDLDTTGKELQRTLTSLLSLSETDFENLKLTYTVPHQGRILELLVGGRTTLVTYDQRFRFADLVNQAKQMLSNGKTWTPVAYPYARSPMEVSKQTPPESDVSVTASVSVTLYDGAVPTLEEFLENAKLGFLLETVKSEGVTCVSELCELHDEDFTFVTKALHRRRLINALAALRARLAQEPNGRL